MLSRAGPLRWLEPLQAVHAADYLEFLRDAYHEWLESEIETPTEKSALLPATFPPGRWRRIPKSLLGRAGYYMSDLSAPLTGGTYSAALASANCALSAALVVSERAGVPVVAASVGGIPDYVVPEKNGLLFPAGDLEAFIRAIQSACAHPLLGRGQVDPETLAKERDYLSPERMARNFLAAYETALSFGTR